jgi:hypothetical protein
MESSITWFSCNFNIPCEVLFVDIPILFCWYWTAFHELYNDDPHGEDSRSPASFLDT